MADHDQQHLPPTPTHAPADGRGEDYVKSAHQADRETAWKAIEAFANEGKGKAADLPTLFHRAAHPAGARQIMGAIAKRTTGEIVFACVREAGLMPGEALEYVLVSAKPPPDKSSCRANRRSSSELE